MYLTEEGINRGFSFMMLFGVLIQIWSIMLQTEPSMDIAVLAHFGLFLYVIGAFYLIKSNVERIFSTHNSIGAIIALIGFAGLLMVLLRILYDLVYPRTMTIDLLIENFGYLSLLGLMARRWHRGEKIRKEIQ